MISLGFAFVLGIVAAEVILWMAFRRKMLKLCFIGSSDASSVRWVRLRHLRIFAILHTTFNCLLVLLLLWTLW